MSVEEARQIDLPQWFTTRLKDTTTDITVQQESIRRTKDSDLQSTIGSPSKAKQYKIARKKPSLKQNTSETSQSQSTYQSNEQDMVTEGVTVKVSDDEGVRDRQYSYQEIYNNSEENRHFRLNITKENEDWLLSQITMDSRQMDTEDNELYSQDSIQEKNQ